MTDIPQGSPLDRALRAAAEDRADRADPDLAKLVNARDHQAAGGQFTLADSTQRLIDLGRATREARDADDRRRVDRDRVNSDRARDRGWER